MKHLFFPAIAAMGIGLLSALPAQADSFTIGVEDLSYLPFYTSDGGKYSGFAKDLLDAYAKDSGHTFTYKILPVKRLMRTFLDGEVDLKFPDNAYWGEDARKGKSISYSDPVVDFIDGVSVTKDKKGKGVDSIKKLGTVRGFTPWAWLDIINSGKTKVSENSQLGGLLKQAMGGRVDGAYANTDVVRYQLTKIIMHPDALVFDPTLPHTKGKYFLSTIKWPDLLISFNTWLKANGSVLAELKKKYGIGG